ncbi:hypothetical protein [Streptomyces sp. BH104]|uniref:hypothetical protein n=1 Tax=Streptomyces sp. BH104 TaxID=3410407 RepID=UPI003BB6F4DD
MARLQILELPMVHNGDQTETPFILVIDQADETVTDDTHQWSADVAKRIGARHVLCFAGTIDIPANDTSAYTTAPEADVHVELDDREVRDLIAGDARKSSPIKSRRNWCCPLAFQTLGREHVDDCRNA